MGRFPEKFPSRRAKKPTPGAAPNDGAVPREVLRAVATVGILRARPKKHRGLWGVCPVCEATPVDFHGKSQKNKRLHLCVRGYGKPRENQEECKR